MEKDKNGKKSLEEIFSQTKIEKADTVDNLKKSFMSYAMAVNVSRAIPDVRDGLKPVHRRILYAMGEAGYTYDKLTRKSARIVGDVMGKYHPHGDSSVYDAMVRLAQNFSIRYPLIDGQGNFGTVDGDPPAAMRYTEARLSQIAELMLEDIDKETVDFYPNFDDSCMQPVVLPSKIPNLLINGSDGIAVGMATNIPPHNLTEVLSGLQALIDDPDIDIDELIKYIPAPDFPTGGIIMGRTAVKHAYKTGRGGIIVRGRVEIEEQNGRQRIVITELPYQVNKAQLIAQIADLVKNKKIEGIANLGEESDRDGMRVIVDIKREANAQVVLNALYKQTPLQKSFGIIFLALVDNVPRVLNLKEMLYYYLEHQKDVLTRRCRFDLKKAQEREHIVKGLVIALANIDEVVKIIRQSDDRQDAQTKLIEAFLLDEIQANAILEMRLSKLTSLEVEKLNQELEELDRTIADLKDILAKPERVLQILRDNFEQIKKQYGDARKTEISYQEGEIELEDLIAREDIVISLTNQGYIKRMPVTEYRAQHRGGTGVKGHKTKDEDFIERMFTVSTHDELLLFSSLGKVYSLKGYEIPEAQKNAKGRAIINLLPLSADEKITTLIPITQDDGYIVMATKGGLIKKTKIEEFKLMRKGGKIAITLTEGDRLADVALAKPNDDIFVLSSGGRCLRFNESVMRPLGRLGQGVKSMKLDEGQTVVCMTVVTPTEEEKQLVTITEKGFGKRCDVNEYRLTGRAGKGIKAGVFNEKTGAPVALKEVKAESDLLLITDSGVVIRTPLENISKISRVSQGVTVMKLKGAKIVSVALTPKAEDDEESEDAGVESNIASENSNLESETLESNLESETNSLDSEENAPETLQPDEE